MDLLALLTFFLLCFLWHRHLSKPTNSKPSLPPKTVSPDKEGEIYTIDPETSLPKLVNSNDFNTSSQTPKTATTPEDSSTKNKGNVIEEAKNGQSQGISNAPTSTPEDDNPEDDNKIKVNPNIYKNHRTPIDEIIIDFEKTKEFASYCKRLQYDTRPHVCLVTPL